MGIFSWIFGDQEDNEVIEVSNKSKSKSKDKVNDSVIYDVGLINELVSEHKNLFDLYELLVEKAKEGQWDQVSSNLRKFKNILQGHILKENVKLYSYLRLVNKADAATLETLDEFKNEMDKAGGEVSKFAKKYEKIDVDKQVRATFLAELESIGPFLVERVHREEVNLYVLYS